MGSGQRGPAVFGHQAIRGGVRAAVVQAGRLEDSLLGHHVEVTRTERRPRATRLMVGDHSQIDLT